MSSQGVMVYGGSIAMVYGVGASCDHGVVARGAGGVLMLRLQEMGKPELCFPLEEV
jgi:hypothetical protein